MNKFDIKSCLLNLMSVLALCFVFCITGGVMQIVASIFLSIVIGANITKHHYIFVCLCGALVLAGITVFYTFAAGMEGFVLGFNEAVHIVLLGAALGISTNVRLPISKAVLICGAIYLVNTLISFATIGESISYAAMLEQMKETVLEAAKAQQINYDQMLSVVEETVSQASALSYKLMPAFTIIGAGFSSLVLVVLYKWMLPKLNKDAVNLGPISSLRADKTASIMFVLILVFGISMQDALIADVFLNILVILLFAFYLFGSSYIDYAMKKRGARKSTRRLVVICILPLMVLLTGLPLFVVAGVGFLDGFFNFRRKRKKEGENGPQ